MWEIFVSFAVAFLFGLAFGPLREKIAALIETMRVTVQQIQTAAATIEASAPRIVESALRVSADVTLASAAISNTTHVAQEEIVRSSRSISASVGIIREDATRAAASMQIASNNISALSTETTTVVSTVSRPLRAVGVWLKSDQATDVLAIGIVALPTLAIVYHYWRKQRVLHAKGAFEYFDFAPIVISAIAMYGPSVFSSGLRQVSKAWQAAKTWTDISSTVRTFVSGNPTNLERKIQEIDGKRIEEAADSLSAMAVSLVSFYCARCHKSRVSRGECCALPLTQLGDQDFFPLGALLCDSYSANRYTLLQAQLPPPPVILEVDDYRVYPPSDMLLEDVSSLFVNTSTNDYNILVNLPVVSVHAMRTRQHTARALVASIILLAGNDYDAMCECWQRYVDGEAPHVLSVNIAWWSVIPSVTRLSGPSVDVVFPHLHESKSSSVRVKETSFLSRTWAGMCRTVEDVSSKFTSLTPSQRAGLVAMVLSVGYVVFSRRQRTIPKHEGVEKETKFRRSRMRKRQALNRVMNALKHYNNADEISRAAATDSSGHVADFQRHVGESIDQFMARVALHVNSTDPGTVHFFNASDHDFADDYYERFESGEYGPEDEPLYQERRNKENLFFGEEFELTDPSIVIGLLGPLNDAVNNADPTKFWSAYMAVEADRGGMPSHFARTAYQRSVKGGPGYRQSMAEAAADIRGESKCSFCARGVCILHKLNNGVKVCCFGSECNFVKVKKTDPPQMISLAGQHCAVYTHNGLAFLGPTPRTSNASGTPGCESKRVDAFPAPPKRDAFPRSETKLLSGYVPAVPFAKLFCVFGDNPSDSVGCAFRIGSFVYTCDHVIKQHPNNTLRSPNSQRTYTPHVDFGAWETVPGVDVARARINVSSKEFPSFHCARHLPEMELACSVYFTSEPGNFKLLTTDVLNPQFSESEVSYVSNSEPGWSGAPVYDKRTGTVVAIHSAGGKQRNYGVPLTFIPGVVVITNTPSNVLGIAERLNMHSKPARTQDGLVYLGSRFREPIVIRPRVPNAFFSNISNLPGDWDVSAYGRSLPTDETNWQDFSKFGHPGNLPNMDFFDVAVRYYRHMMSPFTNGSSYASHEDVVSASDLSKSCGYPINQRYRTAKAFFDENSDKLKVAFDNWQRGIFFEPYFTIFGKDEIRPISKLSQGKVRTICGVQRDFLYIAMRYHLKYNKNFYESAVKTWNVAGFSPYYSGWHELISGLRKPDWNYCSKDCSRNDSTQTWIEMVSDVEDRWLSFPESERTDELYCQLWMLGYFVVFSKCVLPDGSIYQKFNGHTSGWDCTTIFNTKNLIKRTIYSVVRAFSMKFGEIPTYEDIHRNVRAAMYGDDNLLAVSPVFYVALGSNWQWLDDGFAEFGTEVTNEVPPSRDILEQPFLCNTTIFRSGRFVPIPKDPHKILATLKWMPGDVQLTYVRLCQASVLLYWTDFYRQIRVAMDFLLKNYWTQVTSGKMVSEAALAQRLDDASIYALYTGTESKILMVPPTHLAMIEKYPFCPSCGHTVDPLDNFCGDCSSRLHFASVDCSHAKIFQFMTDQRPADLTGQKEPRVFHSRMSRPLSYSDLESSKSFVGPTGTKYNDGTGMLSQPNLRVVSKRTKCPFCGSHLKSGVQHLCTPSSDVVLSNCEMAGINPSFLVSARNARQRLEIKRALLSGPVCSKATRKRNERRRRKRKSTSAVADIEECHLPAPKLQSNAFGEASNPGPRRLLSTPSDRRRVRSMPWYHPVRVVATAIGATQPDRKKARDRFIDAIPVAGILNQWLNPEPEDEKGRDPVAPKLPPNMFGEASNPGPPKGVDARKAKTGRRKKNNTGRSNPQRRAKAKKMVSTVKKEIASFKKMSQQPRMVSVRTIPKSVTLRSTSTNSYRFKGRVLLNTLLKSMSFAQYASNWFFDSAGLAGNSKMNFIDINPYSISVLANMMGGDQLPLAVADYFEKWRGSFRFKYVHSCADTTPGSFGFYIDKDPADTDEDFIGSQQLIARMDSHGGKQSQYALDSSYVASGNNLYLRQAANSDIRKVSAGHAFWFNMMDPTALGSVIELGNMYLEYDITLYNQCANERLMFTEWTYVVSGTIGATYTMIPTMASRKFPYSNLIVPATNTTSATVSGVVQSLILNSNQATPTSYFIQVQGQVINGNAVALYFNANGVDLTSTCVVEDFAATSALGTTCFSFVVLVPANLPPNSATIRLTATAIATGSVTYDAWTLPSTFFSTDWSSLPPLNWSSIKSKISSGELKQSALSDKSIEQKIEEMCHVLEELKEAKKVDVLHVEQDSPVIVNSSPGFATFGSLSKQLRLSERADRIGEAKNPGPKKCLTQNLKPWLLKCQNSDVTVRKTRIDLADQWKGIEDPNGAYVMSNETYFSLVVFLRNTRSPAKDEQLLGFAKAVQSVLDELDEMETKVDN